MLRNYEALADLSCGQALPFFATVDGETVDLPVLIGVVSRAAPVDGRLDYLLHISYAGGRDYGPSLRITAGLNPPEPPVFGAAPDATRPAWVVAAWLNPADEMHLVWVERALARGGFGVEMVTPDVAASLPAGARSCRYVALTEKISAALQRDFYRGMAEASALPWADLDFRAACAAHARQHPTTRVFAG